MFLKNLKLKNFRNYSELNLNFNKDTILVVGDNGKGKTNLLESIYYVSSGNSHRTNEQVELINWENDYAVIRALFVGDEINGKQDEHLVELELRKDGMCRVKIDGVYYQRKADFISILPSVFFSPDDLRIIKSGPSNRRDFLDDVLKRVEGKRNGEFFILKNHYQKVLNHRNSLIKSISGNGNSYNQKSSLFLDTWNESLVNYGCRIIEKRIKLLNDFKKDFTFFINLFFPEVEAEIRYVFSWDRKISADSNFFNLRYKNNPGKSPALDNTIGEDTALENSLINLTEKFYLKLKENLRKDLIYKTTITGPHRDDFNILINGKDIKSFGSQGQQRITLICLKLCEVNILKEKIKTKPVLLLDDVLSELDNEKKRLLLEILKNNRFQTFITTANPDVFKALDLNCAEKFLIANNKISQK
ncbi:MAG: DNA replication/repair protein RecF [Actinobacteria bacterium]|nr:DNA replication/repair protein RecF [Actinomycetota bacterium]MBM3711943.1 DNA replication/repair protein RecF [Actinomycetota bacterium]